MLTMFFCNINQLIVYLVVLGSLACNDVKYYESEEYDMIGSLMNLKRLGPKKRNSLLTKCLGRRGVCMPSHVCPWEKILEDQSDSCMLAEGGDSLCCQVSRVRMISDLFVLY